MNLDARDLDATRLCIARRKQFFFDDLIIESVENLTRRVHAPEKHPASPLIRRDRPWEKVTYFTCSSWRVIRDPADGLFKCWYEDWQFEPNQHFSGSVSFHDPRYFPSRYLYAQSRDGIHWEKPELDVRSEDGRWTNIVIGDREFRSAFGSVHSGYVFLDPFAAGEEHRYKLMFNHRRPGIDGPGAKGVYEIASSPDGIHWRPWGGALRLGPWGPQLGDVLTLSVDLDQRVYILNTRHPRMGTAWSDPDASASPRFLRPYRPLDPMRNNKRRIFQSRSADLLHWSEPEPIVVPDDGTDNIDDGFYGMAQHDMGGMWVGFLDVFHATDNTMDVQLLYSRNGHDFRRIQPGRPWLAAGDGTSWDRCMVNAYGGPVAVGDELYVYHGGAQNHHDWWIVGRREGLGVPEAQDMSRVGYALGLAVMKADRFVGLAANGVRLGVLATRPFFSDGGRLVINARCAAGGSIRVAVLDSAGIVVHGLGNSECLPFTSDTVSHEVTWTGRHTVPEGWISLRFSIDDAELFSFRIEEPA
jgi:hypothetical protein